MRKIDVRKHAATTCRPISDDQSRTLSSATNDAFRVSPVAIGFLFFYFKRNTFKVNSYPANHIHTTHLYTTSTKKKKRSKVNDKKWQAFSCNGRWRTRSSSLFFAHPKKSLRLPFSIHFFVPCLRVVAVRDVRTFNWWGADRILIEMIGRLISCDSGGALIKFRRYLFVRSSASASFLFFFFFFFCFPFLILCLCFGNFFWRCLIPIRRHHHYRRNLILIFLFPFLFALLLLLLLLLLFRFLSSTKQMRRRRFSSDRWTLHWLLHFERERERERERNVIRF